MVVVDGGCPCCVGWTPSDLPIPLRRSPSSSLEPRRRRPPVPGFFCFFLFPFPFPFLHVPSLLSYSPTNSPHSSQRSRSLASVLFINPRQRHPPPWRVETTSSKAPSLHHTGDDCDSFPTRKHQHWTQCSPRCCVVLGLDPVESTVAATRVPLPRPVLLEGATPSNDMPQPISQKLMMTTPMIPTTRA